MANEKYLNQSTASNTAVPTIAPLGEQMRRSTMREFFFNQDNYRIQSTLKSDLLLYIDNADISRMKLITLDFFIPAFLEFLFFITELEPEFVTLYQGLCHVVVTVTEQPLFCR